MSTRSAHHDTFVIERTYPASPDEVFALWSSREAKQRWFGDPANGAYELDFTVGGHERNAGCPPGGPVYTYDAEYFDIVPDQRIVYAYEMSCDGKKISVSVATVEFSASGSSTRLILTEQGVFLDGGDTPDVREKGTAELLDKLGGLF